MIPLLLVVAPVRAAAGIAVGGSAFDGAKSATAPLPRRRPDARGRVQGDGEGRPSLFGQAFDEIKADHRYRFVTPGG